jgi:galactokinase
MVGLSQGAVIAKIDEYRGAIWANRTRAGRLVTEKHRTLAAAAAMRAGDIQRLGALLLESHASLAATLKCPATRSTP